MTGKWQVRIPKGRWMGGEVHRFSTKRRAVEFIDRWNQVEVNSGNGSLKFHRFGPTTYEPLEA
jgi:hypothetical protein